MPTRDLGNKRIMFRLGTANSVLDLEAPTPAECNAMLPAHQAIRWDGFDFGMQESEQIDDRTLDDDAAATLRGFLQFGGALPVFWPKVTDASSILRQVYNLTKAPRTELIAVERVGFKDANEPVAAGDNLNVYRIMTDGFNPDTEGTGGYAYLLNLLPRGDAYPWTIAPESPAAQVAIVGGLTLSLAAGAHGLRGATYLGNNIATRGTWASSDQTKVLVDNRGIITGLAAGTASVTCTFPGGQVSSPVVVTVT